MAVLLILFTLCAVYLISNAYSLLKNYNLAKQSGLPILVSPIHPYNPVWQVLGPMLGPTLERTLPSFVWGNIKCGIYGWSLSDRGATHAKYGKSFIYVTPGSHDLWTADVDIATAVLNRRNDFQQFYYTTVLIGIFGENVMTTNGNDWERHKRIVGPALNERVSLTTWDEAVNQTKGLLEQSAYTPKDSALATSTTGIFEDLRLLAFNCLQSSSFGVSQPYVRGTKAVAEGDSLTFSETLHVVVEYLVPTALLPTKIALAPLMPKVIHRIGLAKRDFPKHTRNLLQEQKQRTKSDHKGNNENLLAFLLKASDDERAAQESSTKGPVSQKLYLSEDEIVGNLFQLIIAGYEAGANTTAYAFALLAIHPELQDWVHEEISQVLNSCGNPTKPAYEDVYHRLPRCLAVMHETLRLYPPILAVSRTSTPTPQQIHHPPSGKTYTIPPSSGCLVDSAAIHVDPSIWGSDCLDYRPSRWIVPNGQGSGTNGESMYTPPKNTFLPWSGGARACPGMKSSQVKFVAVMCSVFGSWRCIPKAVADAEADAGDVEVVWENEKTRIRDIVRDSGPRVTIQMNRAGELGLVFVRR